MITTPEQLVQLNKATLDSLQAAALVSMEGLEKLAELNLQAARASIDESTLTLKSLLETKDAKSAADLAAAEYVPPSRDMRKPLFEGSALSVTFVRTALGPNAGVGLDLVRIGETTDQGHLVTVRSRGAFAPIPLGASPSGQLHLSDAVVLLRAPLRRPASTTTTPSLNPEISRFRTRNRCRAGGVPGGYSLTTAPVSAIFRSSSSWPAG